MFPKFIHQNAVTKRNFVEDGGCKMRSLINIRSLVYHSRYDLAPLGGNWANIEYIAPDVLYSDDLPKVCGTWLGTVRIDPPQKHTHQWYRFSLSGKFPVVRKPSHGHSGLV